ncbi:MAG TPA: NAD-dependent epimerase/dehydratase family protein [Vicinamibacteria bacterium]|nr:NAD-dependent epimerase/dehydratase family protein [Vicinamibacteria bacterium]
MPRVKVVVTGAAGFIGSHLSESLLASGHEVVGIDAFTDYYPREAKERNLEGPRSHRGFRLVEGRLQDIDLRPVLEGARQIFHLAAQAGVRASWGREFAHYTDHNVLATQRLLEAARQAGAPRIVYASSSSVYGDAPRLPLREDARCEPVSPYGVSKLAAEHLAILYERNFGLPVVSLRYFTVYGPRQRPDMAFHRFLKAARDGEPIHVFGDGAQTRDFTFVADIVAATRAAADSGRPGRVYNVGGGERIALNDVLQRIEEVTGRRLTAIRDEAQKGDMRDTFADTTAAGRDLGFRSTVSLTQGLEREWQWIRSLA